MEQLFLMPGEERYERFKDGNGVPKVHYSYRSMRGAFFDCESRSLEEAQRLCENWLVGQDRCYRRGYFCYIGFTATPAHRQVPVHCRQYSGIYPKSGNSWKAPLAGGRYPQS